MFGSFEGEAKDYERTRRQTWINTAGLQDGQASNLVRTLNGDERDETLRRARETDKHFRKKVPSIVPRKRGLSNLA